MESIFDKFDASDFPNTNEFKKFAQAFPIGPEFAQTLAETLFESGAVVEFKDFITNQIGILKESEEIVGYDDILYLIYSDPRDWVYVFYNDLSWGIVFSNIGSEFAGDKIDLEKSRENFLSCYKQMTTVYPSYYDIPVLENWQKAARIDE